MPTMRLPNIHPSKKTKTSGTKKTKKAVSTPIPFIPNTPYNQIYRKDKVSDFLRKQLTALYKKLEDPNLIRQEKEQIIAIIAEKEDHLGKNTEILKKKRATYTLEESTWHKQHDQIDRRYMDTPDTLLVDPSITKVFLEAHAKEPQHPAAKAFSTATTALGEKSPLLAEELLKQSQAEFTEREIMSLAKRMHTQKQFGRSAMPKDFVPILKEHLSIQRKIKRKERQYERYMQEQPPQPVPEEKPQTIPAVQPVPEEKPQPQKKLTDAQRRAKRKADSIKKDIKELKEELIPSPSSDDASSNAPSVKTQQALMGNALRLGEVGKKTKQRSLILRQAILDGVLGEDDLGYDDLVEWIYALRDEHPQIFASMLNNIMRAITVEDEKSTRVHAPIIINMAPQTFPEPLHNDHNDHNDHVVLDGRPNEFIGVITQTHDVEDT